MNVLLVNLTRFGDLLQSQAAVNALACAPFGSGGFAPLRAVASGASKHECASDCQFDAPQNQVALVCLANFAAAGSFLRNITHYFPLPKDTFLGALLGGPEAAPANHGLTPGFENWTAAVTQLWQWREQVINEFKPDLICNLTPTVPARLLAGYLASGQVAPHAAHIPVCGFALDEQGFALNGPWATYLQGASRNRGLSPFNVVDVFRAVAGQSNGQPEDTALLRPDATAIEAMHKRLCAGMCACLPGASPAEDCEDRKEKGNCPETSLSLSNEPSSFSALQTAGRHNPDASESTVSGGARAYARQARGFIGFQLGASEERRQWPLEYFVRLGQRLWRELGYVPVLLGSRGEMHLAEEYAALNLNGDSEALRRMNGESAPAAGDCECAAPGLPADGEAAPFVSLVGSTGLGELAAALCNCDLLISNDTGTMHMAAGLGRPVLGIFLATAQPWDTGPALAGCCTLEPGLACHPCAFGAECPYEHMCRFAVEPERVFELAASFLLHGDWSAGAATTAGLEPVVSCKAAGSAAVGPRVWLTETDEYGFFILRSLSGHEAEPRSIWFREQREFLRQFLDREGALLSGDGQRVSAPSSSGGPEPGYTVASGASGLPASAVGARSQQKPGAANYAEAAAEPGLSSLSSQVREKLAAELTYFDDRLASLLDQGKLLSLKPLPRFRELFLESLRELTAKFEDSQFLGTLGFLWRIEVHEQGVDLNAAMSCVTRYKELISRLHTRFTA